MPNVAPANEEHGSWRRHLSNRETFSRQAPGSSPRPAAFGRRIRLLPVILLLSAGCGSGAPPSGGSATAWEQVTELARDESVVLERVVYRQGSLRILGQVCRPVRAGRFPIAVANHGGWTGLGPEWGALGGACATVARLGYVVLASSYRGEDGSGGQVEFCAGEADDVARMLSIAQRQAYADPSHVIMYGGSHGGCVTLRALQNGVHLHRAASWNAPIDLAGVHGEAVRQLKLGATGAVRQYLLALLAALEGAFDGPPAQHAARYAERSPMARASSLSSSSIPLLIQHGLLDEVVPVAQPCALAMAIGGFLAYRVAADGTISADPPAACAHVGLQWSAGPLPAGAWAPGRYLVIYDGYAHAAGPQEELLFYHLFSFLGAL